MTENKLRQACRATLLFHGGHSWDDVYRVEWRKIVDLLLGKDHHGDATTKVLCDIQRAALEGIKRDYEPEQAYGTSEDIREHLLFGGTMEDY